MVNGSDDGTLNKVVYVNESDLNVEVNNYRVKLDDAQLTKIDDCINRKGLILWMGPVDLANHLFLLIWLE